MTYERPEHLAEKISPELVANYLARHPEFFQDHTELLKSLYIPHPSGEAVSLVAKQLELLRDENRKLQKQYKDLVDIGRNNDAVLRKMHSLVLALMKAHTLEEAIQSLTDMLQSNFSTDFVSLNIIMDGETDSVLPSRGMRDLAISPDNHALQLFAAIIENNQPQCGHASQEQLEFLFPNNAEQVASCAIIPIQHNGFAALMSIGSRDKNRFANDAGIMFLTQMAELVGLRFSSLVDEATATKTFDAVVEQLFSDDDDNIPD
ncbi:MAG: DUF484 family protein [Gammaproteobacteria bacterium]|nr:DUF484 family protein [Gammaproteobacteria bacterium]